MIGLWLVLLAVPVGFAERTKVEAGPAIPEAHGPEVALAAGGRWAAHRGGLLLTGAPGVPTQKIGVRGGGETLRFSSPERLTLGPNVIDVRAGTATTLNVSWNKAAPSVRDGLYLPDGRWAAVLHVRPRRGRPYRRGPRPTSDLWAGGPGQAPLRLGRLSPESRVFGQLADGRIVAGDTDLRAWTWSGSQTVLAHSDTRFNSFVRVGAGWYATDRTGRVHGAKGARWSAHTGAAVVVAHASGVLITGGLDGFVRVWQPDEAEPLFETRAPGAVDGLAIEGDRLLVSVRQPLAVYDWRVIPGEP